MSTFYDHIKWISGVSCIVSTVILLYYIRDVEKRFLMVMFLIGFWLESVGLFFFLPLNKNNHVICDGDAYYVPEAPECVMQSFMLIYSFIWVMVWCINIYINTISYHLNIITTLLCSRKLQELLSPLTVFPLVINVLISFLSSFLWRTYFSQLHCTSCLV